MIGLFKLNLFSKSLPTLLISKAVDDELFVEYDEEINCIIEDYTFYEPEYCKAHLRTLNLNSIDREIQVKVFDRRNKLSEKIELVMYHFEIMRENRLISDLRNKIHQRKTKFTRD